MRNLPTIGKRAILSITALTVAFLLPLSATCSSNEANPTSQLDRAK